MNVKICKKCLEHVYEDYMLNDICLECNDKLEYPKDYYTPDFSEMIMTYDDQTLNDNK